MNRLPAVISPAEFAFEDGEGNQDVFRLPAQRSSVSTARVRVSDRLRQWGVCGETLDDAILVLSELFTNAVVHTDSNEITCRLCGGAERLYLAIADQGRATADHDPRDPDEGGRGLLLVGALAERWGVARDHSHGRVVWAILAYAAEPRAREGV